ncbi:TonB-dependent receptor [Dysgonomonas sp. 521]|uniref:TonB-dependent receptor n=1 Tax=Dysgonomonas sp. 521 TaxID=2302932 RepID=UPI0013D5746E|nr:TonB-dependent receptor [Dysgonomonas sp. 521]NDV97007.1 TonB-dependent receptor [Dysgonomonas sp. 521]
MNLKHILLFIFLFCTIIDSIHADDIPIDNDSIKMRYTAKEVVIESFKQNSDISVQPISASILSASIIKENNIVHIKEVSAFVPNLFMPDYGSKMTSPVYIRGIGSAKNAPSVGLYVDGVPYFDRSTFDINISDIDRIEVLRGPQGTIYGRNTMGGIINVFTKSPLKTTGTNINLSAGNYNTYQTAISHYGNVDNKVGYSLSGNYMHAGGYFMNKTTGKRADPIGAVSTRARLSWRIMPRLTANLILAYEYSDQDGYPYRIYDKETKKMEDINYDARSFYRRNMSTNGLNIEYVTDNFKLGSQTSFQFYDGKQGLDQDFSPENLYYVDFYQRQQMYSQEFNIKSLREDSNYKWQFGIFGFHQNYFQVNDVDYRSSKKHVLQNVHNPTEGIALYHQSTLNDIFIPGLSATFGIRYDWERTKSSLIRTTKNPDAKPDVEPEVKIKDHFSQITPKGSIQYAFNRDGLAYFSVSKGYKTGGFNNTADEDKDRTFDPEHSWCYELGTKSGFLDNLLYLDLTLFYIKWNDQQISQTKPTGQGFLIRNAGKSESKGIEFSAQVNPVRNLSFQLSYGYTHAKYKEYKESETTSYDNNYLPMVPKNTLAISANYTIETNQQWLDNIMLNAQYTGVGKIYWNDTNDVEQSYYGLYSGKVSFVKKQFSLDLWAKNIGSKNYIAYYFKSSGDFVQKGKPFTCGINVNMKF